MNISVLSIRRPVLAIVMSVFVVIAGVIGYLFLGIRQFPNVDPPIINVTTLYAGANPDVVESQITEPLEESINGISGVRSITSSSSDGRSAITVEFFLSEDLEAAANDVRDRVARAQRSLPPDADPPIVAKQDANSQAVMVATVQSESRTLVGLTDIAANVFKERLQTIPGVAGIQIWGERRYAIRIIMNPDRLAAYGVTTEDVRAVLQRENVELPAGRLEGISTEIAIRAVGRLSTPEEVANIVVRSSTSAMIRISDIARVYMGAENERTLLKRDGRPMVGLAISALPGANQVDIADEFYRRLDQLKQQAPPDITLDVAFDTTTFIRKAVAEVRETLVIAFALVVLIIFMFLRTWRATIIPVIAIPVSLLSSFFFMWVFGFSINVLTLLGIVLATGLVVDDAIVMMENIFKRIERGEDPRQAGERGSSEIYFAIISTTVTLVVVFIPIIFLQGLTGRLFREFAVVVTMSVIVSSFVSLTLTPMMSTRILRAGRQGALERLTEPFFVWMNGLYERTLNVVLGRPWLAVGAIAATVVVMVVVMGSLKSELPPLEDRALLTMNMTAPEGYTYNRMDMFMDTVTKVVTDIVPEKHLVLTVTSPTFFGGGANSGFGRLILTDPETRTRSQQQIAAMLTKELGKRTEARTIVIQEQTIQTGGGRAGLPVQFVVQAPDMERMRDVLPKFMAKAQANATFSVVDVNLKFNKPEVLVNVERDRARELGVSVADVGNVLQAGFAGQRYGFFVREGKQYQIVGEIERLQRSTPDQLQSVHIRAADGTMVPLASVVSLTEGSTPPQLYRYNRLVSATVSAGLAEGKTIADGIAAMEGIAGEVFPEGMASALTGPSRDFVETSSTILYAFLLALILVYLVLAAQFESWIDPFIILLTVPLALAGGAISLALTAQSLNVFSQIGAIALIGLVTKNGILIVEFANQIHEGGADWRQASFEAAKERFRPILMTSLATILGAAPIALSLGAASTSRIGLGVVVVGGMVFSTFLTLLVIPSMYVLLSKLKKSSRRDRTNKVRTSVAVTIVLLMVCSADVQGQELLTREQAVAEALQKNYAIRLARLDSAMAQSTADAALAGYLPNVVVAGQMSRGASDLTQTLSSGTVIERPDAGFTSTTANALLTWTLFDGLRMFSEDDRLHSLQGVANEQARSRVAMAIADVITAYGGLVQQQWLLRTATQTLALVEERMAVERRRLDAGIISGVELRQAEVDRNQVEAALLRFGTQARTQQLVLNQLLGRPADANYVVDTVHSGMPLPELVELQVLVRRRNPNVVAADKAVEATSHHVRSMRSALYPRVDATGGYQYTNNRNDAGFLLENRSMGWVVGLNFRYDLFRGFSDAVAIEQAEVDRRRAQLQREEIITDVEMRLSQAYRRYTDGVSLLALEQRTMQAAEKNATVALERLRAGTVSSIDARQTLLSVLDAGQRLATVEYESLLAAVEALRLAGVLLR